MENWADAIDISFTDPLGRDRNAETRKPKEIIESMKKSGEWKVFVNDLYKEYMNRIRRK